MTKDQQALLLYLETRAVDHGGLVDTRHMSAADVEQAMRWNEDGFLEFGRILAANVGSFGCSHWVALSEAAWRDAFGERRARAERTWKKRMWAKNSEKNESAVDVRDP